jgi:RNA polymerase sigma factor (sigma-70 family)
MNSKVDSHPGPRNEARQRQSEELHNQEPELRRLAAERNPEFFKQILPFVRPLKAYIKRRLRAAYFDERIRTQVATSGDILDDVIQEAFENFSRKPEGLTLEQWLYQIANRRIDDYIAKAESREKRRRSLETLAQSELRTLDEMPITADAEGEPWLPEDLDDSEYQPRDFRAPADADTPEQQLERKEELQQILWALARVPEQDLLVFDLYAVEGFSKEEVAKILNVPADQVPQIVERVKAQVREQLGAQYGEGTIVERKAS